MRFSPTGCELRLGSGDASSATPRFTSIALVPKVAAARAAREARR
jgi:hypothetical protein